MTTNFRWTLLWAPRALAILFSAFISLFALDVFVEGRGFWQTATALFMHLVPTYVLVGMLILAWRRAWVGAAVSTALGALFLWWNHNYRHNAPSDVLIIAGPLFLMAALYLANWLMRTEPHKL